MGKLRLLVIDVDCQTCSAHWSRMIGYYSCRIDNIDRQADPFSQVKNWVKNSFMLPPPEGFVGLRRI
jgi:hypothetical protein